ncbi:MAG: hypothetical protein IJV50_09600 [Lachnospiraceae bacterium]|nr:hypothetical protein [Lachnospiraceae bacterium]
MIKEEFDMFYQWSVEHHVKELLEEAHMSQAEAVKETTEELAEMLPNGIIIT